MKETLAVTTNSRAVRQSATSAQPALAYPLSEQQCRDFERAGFVILRGLFSAAEVAAWAQGADAIRQAGEIEPANLRYDFAAVEADTGGASRVLWKLDPFHDLHPVFRRLVRDRRIRDALASLYQGREPRLFKDKLICKPPQTHGNQLHQDYTWWQGFPASLISVLIAIDPADASNGCTVLYPGRHHGGLLTEPGQLAFLAPAMVAGVPPVPVLTQPGDIALFTCFTPHEAGPNRSDHTRRQIFLTYNDSAEGEHYQAHYEHFARYVLAGLPESERTGRYLA